MAMDLVARLIVRDQNFTSSFRKATGEVKALQAAAGHTTNSTDRLSKAAGSAGGSFSKLSSTAGRSLSSVSSGAKAAVASVAGLTAALGAAVLGSKALEATIGSAAHREFSTVTTRALFKGDNKTADEYFDFIQKRAIDSPIFEAEDYFKTSKSFVTITKDINNLKALTNIAERLGASDPLQGIEGSAIALRELAGGDGVSLVERFELPRSVVNTIKDLPLEKQIAAMDKLLNDMGYTNELLEEQGATALGRYNAAVGKVKSGLQQMGVQALDRIQPQLERFNKALDGDKFKRFVDVGGRALDRFVDGSIYAFDQGYSAFDSYMNKLNSDEKFNALTWDEKLERVINDAFTALSKWLDESDTVKALTSKALEYGTKFGIAVGEGMLKGMTQFAADNPLLAAALGGGLLLKGGKIPLGKGGAAGGPAGKSILTNPYVLGGAAAAAATGYAASTWEEQKANGNSIYSAKAINGGVPFQRAANPEVIAPISDDQVSAMQDFLSGAPKEATGISYIPRNGMPIIAHRGEALLPAPQAEEYRSGRRGASAINITMNGVTIREEADVQKVASQLVRLMEEASPAW